MSSVLARDVSTRELWKLAAELLTDRHYEALVLVFGEELTYREAALKLGLSEPTVRQRVERALRRMSEAARA